MYKLQTEKPPALIRIKLQTFCLLFVTFWLWYPG